MTAYPHTPHYKQRDPIQLPNRLSNGEPDPLGGAKDAAEAEIALLLGEIFGDQFETIAMELRRRQEQRNPTAPTADFWAAQAALMLTALLPIALRSSGQSAVFTISTLPVGVDIADISAAAAEFAQTHTFDLVGGINNTTRRNIQRSLSKFFQSEGKMTVDDIITSLASSFGPVRAEMIAITETTRSFSEGFDIATDLAREFLIIDDVWLTLDDEKVCPICRPNHEIPRSEGWTVENQPAHPRCRCFKEAEVLGSAI